MENFAVSGNSSKRPSELNPGEKPIELPVSYVVYYTSKTETQRGEVDFMHYQSGPPPVFYKNPGLAAVLSFFYMGLGQIYNGQLAKGILFIVVYSVSILLMMVIIGFITTPILFIYGMYDAYKSAEKINRDLAERTQMQNGPAVN